MQLTQAERDRAIMIALDQVAERVPVICGVMDSSTRRVIDNINKLEQMGGTCAAITPVFYARHSSQDESVRHFEMIAGKTNVDLFIYNMPSMTGISLSPETVIKIGQIDHVVGYKDSSLSYGGFMQVLSHYKNTSFSCMQGVTSQAISALLMGADGFVPALAPLFPGLFVAAFQAGISGDRNLAWKYNELLRESSVILKMSANMTTAAKFAISILGFTDKRIISPQDGIRPSEEECIIKQIELVNGLFEEVRKGK
jgi:4-hydroxy-tetrahydrodipicolinate synthase